MMFCVTWPIPVMSPIPAGLHIYIDRVDRGPPVTSIGLIQFDSPLPF